MTRDELLRELARTDERPVPPGVVVPPPALQTHRAGRRWEIRWWGIVLIGVGLVVALALVLWAAW
jgi:hypothetical protein